MAKKEDTAGDVAAVVEETVVIEEVPISTALPLTGEKPAFAPKNTITINWNALHVREQHALKNLILYWSKDKVTIN